MSLSRPAKQLLSAATIRAVSFDVGGTLITPWPSVGHVYAEVAARHGWPGVSVERLNRNFTRAWKALNDFTYTRPEWAALVKATFAGVIEHPPGRQFFSELYGRFAEPDAWKIYEDVLPALSRLRGGGFALAVISNWDRRLAPLLRKLELRDLFDALVVSCYSRHPKPSRLIFLQASRKLRLPPGSILHVGDSREMDFEGAKTAGLQAVLLDRKGKTSSGTLRSLLELCADLDLHP
jgi:putative hydrolase of the HAD superfamily